jgi:non-ribosomal peptide synthase protein (TIGR01720 family)
VHDNFFDLGGDSILSIQIVARANMAGLRLAPQQLFEHQTIAELAEVAGTVAVAEAEQGLVLGDVPLTPIQRWLLEREPASPHHFNQAFLLEPDRPLLPRLLEGAWAALLGHHDALRLRLERGPEGWRQTLVAPEDRQALLSLDLSGLPAAARAAALESAAAALQASLDLERGPLCRLALIDPVAGGQRLLLVIHHLAVDGVSWRILLEDLEQAYSRLERGEPVRLPRKTTSFQHWARLLEDHGGSAALRAELPFWTSLTAPSPLPLDGDAGDNRVGCGQSVTAWLEEDRTRSLLQEVPGAYNTQIHEVLLAALVEAFGRWTGERCLYVDLEGHGREELFDGVDLSRTVGWFTSLFPVFLEVEEGGPGEALKAVKEQVRQVPRRGIGYGLLRYLGGAASARRLDGQASAQVSFNYLGQFDQTFSGAALLRRAPEPAGPVQSPAARRPHLLDVIAGVLGGRLQVRWIYAAGLHRRDTVERLCHDFLDALRGLIDHCLSPEAGGYTPSDFPGVDLTQEGLDSVLSEIDFELLEN